MVDGHKDNVQGFSYHPGVLYIDGSKKARLPEWSRWLVDLGKWLATEQQAGKILRVAISIPSRGYAALFVAMGVLSGSYRSGALSPEDRLRMLSCMDRGNPVRYSRTGAEFKISSGRFSEIRDDPYLGEVVWIVEGDKRYARKTRKRYARKISEFRYIDHFRAEERFKTDREISKSGRFVEAVTGVNPVDHEFFSRLECLIIGNKNALTQEMSLKLELHGLRGRASDILRVHEQRPKDGYRSRMISPRTDLSSEVLGAPFGGVVLDGSQAILRWKGKVRQYPWLAVIDRTSPTAREAYDEIRDGLATSLEDAYPPVEAPPSGMEALYYWDRRR